MKQRRVLQSGVLAEATVLSAEPTLDGTWGRYTIIYEVRPPGGESFRARAVEDLRQWDGRSYDAPDEGTTVRVRFDPADRTVILVRDRWRGHAAEAAAARRAREDQLLRGGPST